jgi:Ca2+-binding EF-hand superfamily protein
MRKWILALAGVVAMAGVAAAQDEGGERRGRRFPQSVDDFLKAADRDGDGKLSKDEFLRESYERIRANPQFARRMEQLDADKDGAISYEEFLASPMGTARFQALDKDGSGFLERAEIEAMLAERGRGGQRGRPRIQDLIARLDKDGDGKVSREEFSAAFQGREGMFDRLDRNGDGVIDAQDVPAEGERRPGAPPAANPPAPPAPPTPPAKPDETGKPRLF